MLAGWIDRPRVLVAVAVVLLAGCVGIPIRSGEVAGELAVAPEYFEAEGRLSLRRGERADHVNFEWQRANTGERMLLTTPLGQGVAELTLDTAGAHLQRPGVATVHEASLDDLAARIFGADLPLTELRDWLRGARGRTGTAGEWRIGITETRIHDGRQLPRRLDVTNGELSLTILIDQWGAVQ